MERLSTVTGASFAHVDAVTVRAAEGVNAVVANDSADDIVKVDRIGIHCRIANKCAVFDKALAVLHIDTVACIRGVQRAVAHGDLSMPDENWDQYIIDIKVIDIDFRSHDGDGPTLFQRICAHRSAADDEVGQI